MTSEQKLLCCPPPHPPRTVRVLERIGARALVAHVRTFADFLVYEFSISPGGPQLNKCIEILNDMVWKYNIVTLDRLILCLVRRNLCVSTDFIASRKKNLPILVPSCYILILTVKDSLYFSKNTTSNIFLTALDSVFKQLALLA